MADSHHSDSQETDELNTPMIAFVGFFGALITFALIIVVQVFYYQTSELFANRRKADENPPQWQAQKAEQTQDLNRLDWKIEEKDGKKIELVKIPIDQAKTIVLNDLRSSAE